ncbi:MAG: 5-formyltetrahydrofolate cyclo-ligase [Candidatus Omnitrophota bacterium]
MPKNRLREIIKKKLDSQSEEERQRKSEKIALKLYALKEFTKAGVVMFFVSKDGEVQTRQMICEAQALGKKIVIPHINRKENKMLACQLKDMDTELCKGPYGIHQVREDCKQTVGLKSIDLIIVPGIAFNKSGQRLGRGGGYFDRFLRGLSKKTFRVGLAFDFQIVQEIPSFSHDEPVDLVISA